MKARTSRSIFQLGCIVVLTFCFSLSYAYDKAQFEQADAYWAEQSYQLAADGFKNVLTDEKLNDSLKAEVKFKYADALWRAGNPESYEEAGKILKELSEIKGQDRWRAEAAESLAGLYLAKDRWSHQQDIINLYQAARDYWAGATDVKLARPRFIKLSFAFGDYISQNWGWYYTGIVPTKLSGDVSTAPGQPQGLEVLYREVLKVADSDTDKARAYYAMGMSLMNRSYQEEDRKKVVEYFEKVIKDYDASEWADDSYYYLGQMYENAGDFPGAVKAYRQLVSRFPYGTSQWSDDAGRRAEYITQPQLSAGANYTFLPESEIQFAVNWRNISSAEFSIYKLDLADQLIYRENQNEHNRGIDNYQALLEELVRNGRYGSLEKVASWQRKMKDEGKHAHYGENKGLAEWMAEDDEKNIDFTKGKLPAGAYLLLVASGSLKVYDLILVSDLGLVAKVTGNSALFFAFDGKSGKPKAGVNLKYHYRYYNEQNNWVWDAGSGLTDESGLLNVSLKTNSNPSYGNQHNLFVTASDGTMQAFAQGNYYNYHGNRGNWWLYAYPDRPAYRPGERVSFKAIVRGYDGGQFINPEGKQLKAAIYDPQGNTVKEAVFTLNAFGSLHDEFTLDEKAPLGEYRLELRDENNNHIAAASLFRMEEYKLPEYEVKVSPKKKEGGPGSYRLGEAVDVEIDAQYYFGGAVADAEVTYLVYQQAYAHYYRKPREYEWYYDQIHNPYYYGDTGTLIKQETIKTDAHGKAAFTFETPKEGTADLKYRVEVRVVDKSRREIVGTSEIKVTKNAYYAYLNPKQQLYRPGDKAEVEIKTITANEEPVSVEGKITVMKNTWREVRPLPASSPPVAAKRAVAVESVSDEAVAPAAPQQYLEEEVFSKFVKTNDKGEAVFEFEPHQDGYYVVKFTGFDEGGEIISATQVYVCDRQSKDIGYRYGGLQIIAEKDTYKPGETARMMLVSDRPDTYVLFSAEAEGIYDYRLEHIENIVKLIEVPVQGVFTPNVFFMAVSGRDYQLKNYNLPVVVPPEEKFLNIRIVSDKEIYGPQEEGFFDIEVTDHLGRPVSGELSLGIVDKSVYYIQAEMVDDIRKYFYGEKRNLTVQTQASFYQRPYMSLARSEDGKNTLVVDDERKRDAGPVGGARQEGFKQLGNNAVGELRAMESDAAYPASAAPKAGRMLAKKFEMKDRSDMPVSAEEALMDKDAGGAELAEAQVRSDFRSTVIWLPAVVTDAGGKATVKAKFPDSLTTWSTTARAITPGTAVGEVKHEVRTKKELIVRLQAPRFFTERDRVTLSANVHNYTDVAQKVKVTLDPGSLKLAGEAGVWVTVEPNGEARVDWEATAVTAGTANLTAMAQTETVSDAMKKSYPVIPHGIEKFIAETVSLRGGEQPVQTMTFNVPKERIKESTQLDLVLSPSMAAAMLDALPYLAEYPYGCVEQTMSRFLPAVIVVSTMRELGISEHDIAVYINTVMDDAWHPAGVPGQGTPTLEKLDEMVASGLKRLYDFQHSDGGWGWWKDDDSNRFMSAYVVWGLALAQDAGVKVDARALAAGTRFLQIELVQEENNPDMLAWMLHALAQAKSSSDYENLQRERLWEMRDKLNAYTRALYALSEHFRGNAVNATTLARNVINGLEEDKGNGTAHWGNGDVHYRWSDGGIEATAMSIKALVNIDPQSPYVQPAVKWLALNRRGARWKNTRDTAIAVLSLADYLKTTNEFNPDYGYEIFLNGKSLRKGRVNSSNVLSFARTLTIGALDIKDGENTVEIRIDGQGSLYAAGYLKYFTLEEGITPEGNEVFVRRGYSLKANQETLLKGYVEDWKALEDGDELTSGDRVKVDITLEVKNHYEYLIVEDYKPAGFEAVELKSGAAWADVLGKDGFPTGEKVWIYQEFRDQKVAFFITKLPQGTHRISYELRAEVPGEFHGMPNQAHAMYVPEIRANSAEARFSIVDK